MPAATASHDVAPATLKAGLERDDAILVNVREADEYAREHIAGARLHPLSRLTAGRVARVPARSSCSSATAATGRAISDERSRPPPAESDVRPRSGPYLEVGRARAAGDAAEAGVVVLLQLLQVPGLEKALEGRLALEFIECHVLVLVLAHGRLVAPGADRAAELQ